MHPCHHHDTGHPIEETLFPRPRPRPRPSPTAAAAAAATRGEQICDRRDHGS